MLEKPGSNFIPLMMGLAVVGGVLAAGWWWRDTLLSFVEKAEETAVRHDPNQPPPETATVKAVLDSMTIELDTGHSVRYIGVSTPGVEGEVQCFGKEALLANESVIGQQVRLEEEPLLKRAQDGAWTRYVFLLPDPPLPSASAEATTNKQNGTQEGTQNDTTENNNETRPQSNNEENQEGSTEEETRNNQSETTDEPKEFLINERILEGGFGFPVVSQDMKYGERLLSAARFASATGKGLWNRCEITGEAPQLTTQPITDCVIKGKVTTDFKKIYRTPECAAYAQTVVLESQGGRWFCAEDIAQDAGFAKASDC